MQPLKILISHTSIYKKGGWGRIFPLAVGLVKSGNRVTIITTNPRFSFFIKREVIKQVNIIIFPEIIPKRVTNLGFGFLSLILKIIYVLCNNYDIVHSDNGHRPLSGMPCRIHKKLFKSVYVAEWYDWYGKGGQYDSKQILFKILLGRYELKYEIEDKKVADGIVVLSEILRSRAAQFKSSNRVIKIHGGSDVSSIPFLCDNSQIKEKYNIDKDILTFGYINSDSYRLAEFSPLLNAIKRSKLSSKINILLFGESNSLIKQVPVEMLNQIKFFGWIDFTKDYEKLQCVDVFFLLKEDILGNKAGWPNCVGDYLACGRPILLNPIGETVEYCKKYPYAFIETTKDESDLTNKVLYLDKNIKDIRKNYMKIRELSENIVSWESKSKDLLDFYLYLIDKK